MIQEPRDGATGVPTNTLLWAHGRFGQSSAARLIGPDGPVPLEERFFPVAIASSMGTNFPISFPADPLRPNTRYRIEFTNYRDPPDEDVVLSTTFRTGDGPKLDAPFLPVLVSNTAKGYAWVTLELAHDGILIADDAGALGDVRSLSDLLQPTTASFSGLELSPSSRVVRWLSTKPEVEVSLGECSTWPEDDPEHRQVRFGVFDLAGNFSGWSEVMELALPSREEGLVLAAEAEAARQDEFARTHPPKERLGLFEDHNTGCSLGPLSPQTRTQGVLLVALLGTGLACRRGQRQTRRSLLPRATRSAS